MILVERHHIKGSPEIIHLCGIARLLYNKCNYHLRQIHFKKERLPYFNDLHELVRHEECYSQLHNTKTAKQTIRQCYQDWMSYFAALKTWGQDKSKFVKCPKPPGYKKKLAQIIYYKETIRKPQLRNGELVPTNDLFKIKSNIDFQQVVITPKSFGFIIEVRYKVLKKEVKERIRRHGICCVDVGVNNLMAITSDKHSPILVNGRILKSINQQYNKSQSKKNLRKRYWRLENYFHHASKFLIENCKQFKIGTIIIGRNIGWKNNPKMSRKSNQNFQGIPFYKFLAKIVYKAELAGIKVIFTEEAYTSSASFLDRDSIPSYKKGIKPPQFSGHRTNRGLYCSSDDIFINADVNGSANIGRKVIQNSEFLGRLDRSLAARPVRINPLKSFGQNSGSLKLVDSTNSKT